VIKSVAESDKAKGCYAMAEICTAAILQVAATIDKSTLGSIPLV